MKVIVTEIYCRISITQQTHHSFIYNMSNYYILKNPKLLYFYARQTNHTISTVNFVGIFRDETVDTDGLSS